ncbi:MAG: phage portal protein [Pseudomonadota bacterium]
MQKPTLVRRAYDGIVNALTGGGGETDKSAQTTYRFSQLSHSALRDAYRTSWIPRKMVNIPAQDATRRWRAWQADKDQISAIEAVENEFRIRKKVKAARTAARLMGGSAILIGTADPIEALVEPLELDRIGVGDLRYVTVLSRYDLTPGRAIRDIADPMFGMPGDWQVSTGTARNVRIHPSRLCIMEGAPLPGVGTERIDLPWGDSVLQAAYDAFRDTDGVMRNVAQMIFEGQIDTIGIPQLTATLQSDPSAEEHLTDRIRVARMTKSVLNALVHDVEEEIGRKEVRLQGVSDAVDRFLQICAGAADIPLTRFLGTSPAGLNATGESDLMNYYDVIQDQQETEITPSLHILDEVIIRSALGDRPDDVHYNWRPLWQMSDKERAEVGKMTVQTVTGLRDLLPTETLGAAAVNALIENGSLPGLEAAVEAFGTELEGDDDQDERDAFGEDPTRADDAKPMPLYVRRDVLNADEIAAWARGEGFETVLEDLHVTITYSRVPVDWMKMGEAWDETVEIAPGGPRVMEQFGDARVLRFASRSLEWRHEWMKEEGASWDHPEYAPHITISYDANSPDLDDVEPYTGRIVLGPEIFEKIDDDYRDRIIEA